MSAVTATAAAPADNAGDGQAKPRFVTVQLDRPLKRGELTYDKLTIRRPEGSGEFRGVTIADLAQMDVDAVVKVLPRVTMDPTLTPQEAQGLDPADLTSCAMEIADFLLSRDKRPAYPVR